MNDKLVSNQPGAVQGVDLVGFAAGDGDLELSGTLCQASLLCPRGAFRRAPDSVIEGSLFVRRLPAEQAARGGRLAYDLRLNPAHPSHARAYAYEHAPWARRFHEK